MISTSIPKACKSCGGAAGTQTRVRKGGGVQGGGGGWVPREAYGALSLGSLRELGEVLGKPPLEPPSVLDPNPSTLNPPISLDP